MTYRGTSLPLQSVIRNDFRDINPYDTHIHSDNVLLTGGTAAEGGLLAVFWEDIAVVLVARVDEQQSEQ